MLCVLRTNGLDDHAQANDVRAHCDDNTERKRDLKACYIATTLPISSISVSE